MKTELSQVKSELGRSGGATPQPPAFPPGALRAAVTIDDDNDGAASEFRGTGKASILTAVKKGRDECVAQLAKLIFNRGPSKSTESARQHIGVVNYATRRAAMPRFPRELFILRGAPGTGKTDYAMQRLVESQSLDPSDALAARLTHVAAADDFFEHYDDDGEPVYKYEARSLESAHARNEQRVGLAMEAGLHPLFVDCSNVRLWEMKPYVELADTMGYVTTVVEPWEICDRWDDASFLELCGASSDGRAAGKTGTSQSILANVLAEFEPVPEDLMDPLDAIREAARPTGMPRAITGAGGAGKKKKVKVEAPANKRSSTAVLPPATRRRV